MHDKNGVPLNVGDEVTIRASVETASPGATTCNISVRTVEKQTPNHQNGDLITLNANMVEKVNGGSKDVQEAAERGAGVRK